MKKKTRKSFTIKSIFITVICILVILIGLFFSTPSIELWYQRSSFELDSGVFIAALGVMVTGIICWLTAVSVGEVSRSNKENRAYNSVKEQKDRFEKQFTILLQEHYNYLSKLLASDNTLYRPDYLLSLKGFEALSIIRGNANKITTPIYTFMLKDDELLIKLNRWTNGKKIFYFPSKKTIKDKGLTEDNTVEVFMSKDGVLYGITTNDNFYKISYFNASLVDGLILKLESVFAKYGEEAKNIINMSNSVSKNILSPYMRIVYHILKLANKNTSNVKEMKQYTNIIRSIIPNDILILIAINAMFFYRNKTDKINNSYRWSDFSFDRKPIESQLTNDYYKYYNLLIKCDFFEHMAMDFGKAIEEYGSLTISPDFKNIDFRRIRNKDCEPLSLILTGYLNYNFSKIYKAMADATYLNKTNLLIIAFYNGSKMSSKIYRKNKMVISGILSKKENFKTEGIARESKSFFFKNCYAGIYESGYGYINLGSDFIEMFTRGELLTIINYENLKSKNNINSKWNFKLSNALHHFRGAILTRKRKN